MDIRKSKKYNKKNKHKKSKKHSVYKFSKSKRKKYNKKSFHKINGGMFHKSTPHREESPPKLKPIVSRYWSDLTCDETVNVVGNGNMIFEDLKLFLNSDRMFYPWYIDPRQYEQFSQEEKINYLRFYDNEDNKKWLGCQIYLLLTIKDILLGGYSKFDDGNYFFKWLTHRLKDSDPQIFIEDAPRF